MGDTGIKEADSEAIMFFVSFNQNGSGIYRLGRPYGRKGNKNELSSFYGKGVGQVFCIRDLNILSQ